MQKRLVGWFFWVYWPFETVFQSIWGRLSQRGRKRRERIDESKNVQTTPTRTYCECSRPLPYCIQIVGRPSTGSLPSTIAPPAHPMQKRNEEAIHKTVSTGNPLYNDIRYNSKIRYNVNSICTNISVSCSFSLNVPCYSLGKHTFWIFVRIASPSRF